MAISYTYSLANDEINAKAGVNDESFTLNDVWTWERTQTQVLITGLGAPCIDEPLTTPVRPAETLALGSRPFGDVGGIDVIITNYVNPGTLHLEGVDAWGFSMLEDIHIGGNGNYPAQERFGRIDTVSAEGTHDIKIQQNKLGRIWKIIEQQIIPTGDAGRSSDWYIECKIKVGAVLFGKRTDFKSTEQLIEFASNKYIYTTTKGALFFGEAIAGATKIGRKGSVVIFNSSTNTTLAWSGLRAYGSTFICKSSGDSAATAFKLSLASGSGTRGVIARQCVFSGFSELAGWGKATGYDEATNIFIESRDISGSSIGVSLPTIASVTTDIFYINGFDKAFVYTFNPGIPGQLDGVAITNSVTYDLDVVCNRTASTTNSSWDKTKFDVSGANNFQEKVKINIRIVDEDGIGIDVASVNMYDKDGNAVNGFTNPQTTDANGDIPQQTIKIRHYPAGTPPTATVYYPFNIQVTKSGYLKYDGDINITHWHDDTAGHGLVITLKKQKVLNAAEELVRIEEE